jgi:hypothetical protein
LIDSALEDACKGNHIRQSQTQTVDIGPGDESSQSRESAIGQNIIFV